MAPPVTRGVTFAPSLNGREPNCLLIRAVVDVARAAERPNLVSNQTREDRAMTPDDQMDLAAKAVPPLQASRDEDLETPGKSARVQMCGDVGGALDSRDETRRVEHRRPNRRRPKIVRATSSSARRRVVEHDPPHVQGRFAVPRVAIAPRCPASSTTIRRRSLPAAAANMVSAHVPCPGQRYDRTG